MHTLYFPWHCTGHFTCSEMHLFTSAHKKVYAVVSIVWFKVQDLTTLCNRRIRTLKPKTIHAHIYQFCVCVCVCVCACVLQLRTMYCKLIKNILHIRVVTRILKRTTVCVLNSRFPACRQNLSKISASNTRLNRPVLGRLCGLISVGEAEVSIVRVCA